MRRSYALIGLIVLILVLPIALLVVQNWEKISDKIAILTVSKKRQVSPAYSAVSTTPDHTITLRDTAYFDYATSHLGIFNTHGVIDPATHSGDSTVDTRYTISNLRFELVPVLDQFIVGVGGKKNFAGWGTYVIDGDTLIVRVALNFDDPALSERKSSPAEVFLDVAYQTLYFAHGLTPGDKFVDAFVKNQNDIAEYVRSGIFAWPVDIAKTP